MKTFLALLRRDLLVISRGAIPLLVGTLMQPILVVLVFGNLLPRLGLVADEFRTVMLPGLIAITILMSGVQGVLIPLSVDLSGSREVDERLLSPLGVTGVALERVVAGALLAAVSGLIALPVMMLLMHEISGVAVHPRWALLPFVVLLAGLVSASIGLTLGSKVQPRYSGLLFAVILGPMMLFGCAYYSWMSLAQLGILRYVLLVNPLVFISEALRWTITPEVEPMPLPLLFAGLFGFLVLLTWAGSRAFRKRTIL
jgi:ABC-2 type transport system permease protein